MISTYRRLAACCINEDGSTQYANAESSNSILPTLPDPIWELICCHLSPRDMCSMSLVCKLIKLRVRDCKQPWTQFDVFIHNPHLHFKSSQSIFKAWPRVRFMLKWSNPNPSVRKRVSCSDISKWLALSSFPCVQGVDLSHTIIAGECMEPAIWDELLSKIKIGILCASDSITLDIFYSLINLTYLDLSCNSYIEDASIFSSIRFLHLTRCPRLKTVGSLNCVVLNVSYCPELHEIGSLPNCNHIDLQCTPISCVTPLGESFPCFDYACFYGRNYLHRSSQHHIYLPLQLPQRH